jgi:hypothetical protein
MADLIFNIARNEFGANSFLARIKLFDEDA